MPANALWRHWSRRVRSAMPRPATLTVNSITVLGSIFAASTTRLCGKLVSRRIWGTWNAKLPRVVLLQEIAKVDHVVLGPLLWEQREPDVEQLPVVRPHIGWTGAATDAGEGEQQQTDDGGVLHSTFPDASAGKLDTQSRGRSSKIEWSTVMGRPMALMLRDAALRAAPQHEEERARGARVHMAITIARRKCAANVRLCPRPVIFLFRPVIRAAAGRETRRRQRRFYVLCQDLSANTRATVVGLRQVLLLLFTGKYRRNAGKRRPHAPRPPVAAAVHHHYL